MNIAATTPRTQPSIASTQHIYWNEFEILQSCHHAYGFIGICLCSIFYSINLINANLRTLPLPLTSPSSSLTVELVSALDDGNDTSNYEYRPQQYQHQHQQQYRKANWQFDDNDEDDDNTNDRHGKDPSLYFGWVHSVDGPRAMTFPWTYAWSSMKKFS